MKKTDEKKKNDTDSDDDDDVDFGDSSPKGSKSVHFLDDEADEDNEEKDKETTGNVQEQIPSSQNDPNDEDDDEDSMVDDDDDDFSSSKRQVYSNSNLIPMPKQQPAFSPSSTPLDLTRRYLCWNHMGSVTLMQSENSRNTIDINFTDSESRRPISFTDNINFIIGSVGEDGGIFASDLQDDDDDDGDDMDGLDDLNMSERTKQAVRADRKKGRKGDGNAKPTGSSIFFYRFETFGPARSKDWYLTLPDGERVLGASCGEGWSAVMTR